MKFYEKTWFIVIMLIIFFPVGLILVWTNKKWSQKGKITATAVVAILLIIGLIDNASGGGESATASNTAIEETKIETTSAEPETEATTTEETTAETEAATTEEITAETEAATTEEITAETEVSTTTTKETTTAATKEEKQQMYVLNTSSKKIHYPKCRAVEKIASDNYDETYDYDGAIANGYEPCGICEPRK